MSNLPGWNYTQNDTLAGDYAADITEAQCVKITGNTSGRLDFAVAGAGEQGVGFAPKTIDISVEGEDGYIVSREGARVVAKAAASIAVNNLCKCAASGTLTPVTADQDFYVFRALTAQTTVGGYVQGIIERGYYATT